MKIPLVGEKSKGLYAIVDDCDYQRVSEYKWHCGNGYAVNSFGLLMHRLIMRPPRELVVDHLNHNRLDNRRANLRVCTQFENSQNMVCKPVTNGGVYYHKEKDCWVACLCINGKRVSRSRKRKEDAENLLERMRKGEIPESRRRTKKFPGLH